MALFTWAIHSPFFKLTPPHGGAVLKEQGILMGTGSRVQGPGPLSWIPTLPG